MSLGWVENFCRKTICMTFDRSSLILDRSSQADLHSKSCSYSILTLHKKQILWASLNKTKMFWSWFANIINWSSNTFKPKVLEPNSLYIEIFYYKICLEAKKMWETSRKIAFSACNQKHFPNQFSKCNQTLENIFLSQKFFHLKIFYTWKIFYILPNVALVSYNTCGLSTYVYMCELINI